MTSKLKCPFCGAELQETFGAYMCRHAGCKICCCLLPPCMVESLIQAKQDLEIATKALKQIVCADKDGKPLKGVVSCWLDMDELNKCIEQITHDNSEKANSAKHKEQK